MRQSYRIAFTASVLAVVTGAAISANAAFAGGAAGSGSSPRITINNRTYIWLLPRFWMNGEKSFAYFRIENPYSRPISFYMHCHASERPIPGMSGYYTLRPRQVKIVDSRKYDAGGRAVLVNCSLRSHDRAKVQHMIRDERVTHFGDRWRLIRPEIS